MERQYTHGPNPGEYGDYSQQIMVSTRAEMEARDGGVGNEILLLIDMTISASKSTND